MQQGSTQYRPQSASEAVKDVGAQAMQQAETAATAARDTARDYPLATVAAVAGLAFIAGAVWKLGRSREQGMTQSLLSRLSDLQRELPSRWRL